MALKNNQIYHYFLKISIFNYEKTNSTITVNPNYFYWATTKLPLQMANVQRHKRGFES